MTEDQKLTTRELQIMEKLSNGLPDNKIAESLFISLETVKAHNKNIFRKLKLRNRSEVVLYWLNKQFSDSNV